ncbi:MAG TPA: ABC transporter ATP-binding protein [Candidatus Polarisedimenticolaceae bacterium]|nr:ABC transporter ATP-binding protein [Candidatus Polarisedimenticolaceae bacterium]
MTGAGSIELRGLGVRFGGRPILQDLTATLTGRAIGLLGPNGAGKTTLLHTLLGFHRPSEGSARMRGEDVTGGASRLSGMIGYMPESDAFIAGITAVRFVRMMGEISGLPPEAALERAHETLHYVGLGEARYRTLEGFSLGMKQMAKLAQAIVHAPKILFLDEPTNGLDPPARARMIRLVKEIRDAGQSQIVLSSHLLRDVEECCDEVLVLKAGRIAFHGNLEEERRANRKFLQVETRGDERAFAAAAEAIGCTCALISPGRLKMILPEAIEVRDLYKIAAAQQIQIRKLDYKRDSLQDIFLKAMEEPRGRL